MANPQKEDGYVGVENHLFEALYKSKFTIIELRILLCIIRLTYGFNTKTRPLSLSYIEQHTGIDKANISRALNHLNECHVITITKGKGVIPQTISIQKDYEKWQGCQISNSCKINNARVVKDTTLELLNQQPFKYNIKDKIKDNNNIVHLPSWFEDVWKAYPNKKGKDKISKKCYKELEAAGKETLLKAIEGIKAFKEQNEWYSYQNGSTFFNGGWKDYLNTEIKESAEHEENTGGKKWQSMKKQ